MERINIGITISFNKHESEYSVWLDSIRQNIAYLYMLLYKTNLSENVFIINTSKDVDVDKFTDEFSTDDFNFINYSDIKANLQLVIDVNQVLNKTQLNYLKNRGCKLVSYVCKNLYIEHTTNMTKTPKKGTVYKYNEIYDEVWINEQYSNTSFYLKKLFNCDVHILPQVWDSFFINKIVGDDINKYCYNINKTKNISIFESNKNITKTSIYPMFIVDETYKRTPNIINRIQVTNTSSIISDVHFNNITNQLVSFNNDKIDFYSRFKLPYFLKSNTDFIVSHQSENSQNLIYYDILYLKYPLIHNSELLKDYGYYYSGFNVEEGSSVLEKALIYHDIEMVWYNKKSEELLKRVSIHNKDNISEYEKRIFKLFR